MAKVEMDTDTRDREENISPTEEDSPPVLNDTPAPLNFCELAPCDFGISIQSFAPASSSNHKDKSRLAQIKARRQSSVGVRGSPVTNSLIRFMAQQKMKTPPTSQTPELVRGSPYLPRATSTLRQKMASFQSQMHVEESDAADPLPTQDSNTGGCIKTRDYLSDGSSHGGKENNPPVTPTSSKRRRLGPLKACSEEIREASTPILHSSWKEREDGGFELQRTSQPLPDDPTATTPPQCSSPFQITSFPSLLEMKPTGEDGSTGASTVKKKRVRFGGPLSPEFFDKNLPPSTPLQKGGTPALVPTPGGRVQLRSVLKTPQRSQQKTPQPQPDMISPTALGSSPVFSIPRHHRMPSKVEDDGKIVFPSIEDLDSAVTSYKECMWDAQPLNLNIAFHEESLSQTVTESDTQTCTPSLMDVPDHPLSHPEETKPEVHIEEAAPALPSNKTQKPATEVEPTSNGPAHSKSRKREQSEGREPVKRSTRSAAKSASVKMKLMSKTTHQWSKDVDRSLYGSREHASKNPTLSPITESLSFISQSPAAPEMPISCTAPGHETHVTEPADNNQTMSDLGVTNTLETEPGMSLPSPISYKESTFVGSRRLSGQRGGRRGLKKRKVSIADSNVIMEELCEDQTTTRPKVSEHTELEREKVDTDKVWGQKSAEMPHTEGDSECHASLHAATSVCSPPAEESNNTDLVPRKAKRGRKRTVKRSVQQNHAEEHQTSHDLEERAQEDQATVQQEHVQLISDSQEETGAANAHLASWQTDFNFEDVFKPVATRGQRSVRRSLRNQSNTKHSGDGAGLAWLTYTSPISSKTARRKSQDPQLRAALPVQPSLPTETQDTS